MRMIREMISNCWWMYPWYCFPGPPTGQHGSCIYGDAGELQKADTVALDEDSPDVWNRITDLERQVDITVEEFGDLAEKTEVVDAAIQMLIKKTGEAVDMLMEEVDKLRTALSSTKDQLHGVEQAQGRTEARCKRTREEVTAEIDKEVIAVKNECQQTIEQTFAKTAADIASATAVVQNHMENFVDIRAEEVEAGIALEIHAAKEGCLQMIKQTTKQTTEKTAADIANATANMQSDIQQIVLAIKNYFLQTIEQTAETMTADIASATANVQNDVQQIDERVTFLEVAIANRPQISCF